jgi:hypothetical protein
MIEGRKTKKRKGVLKDRRSCMVPRRRREAGNRCGFFKIRTIKMSEDRKGKGYYCCDGWEKNSTLKKSTTKHNRCRQYQVQVREMNAARRQKRKAKKISSMGRENACGEAKLEAQLATFVVQRSSSACPGRLGDLGTGANREESEARQRSPCTWELQPVRAHGW